MDGFLLGFCALARSGLEVGFGHQRVGRGGCGLLLWGAEGGGGFFSHIV